MRIGIIGSGVVGLTLAYEITNNNPEYEITIFEKEANSIKHNPKIEKRRSFCKCFTCEI